MLKPGGRFAVSDVVVRGEVPPAIRRSMELWVGCIAGALGDDEYAAKLAAAGFVDIGIEITRIYDADDAREFLAAEKVDFDVGGERGRRQVRERLRPRREALRLLRPRLLLALTRGDASPRTGWLCRTLPGRTIPAPESRVAAFSRLI